MSLKTFITSAKPTLRFFLFTGTKADGVSADELLKQLGKNAPVEEREFDDFFKRLTEMQEWFGDEEIATANKFSV